MKFLKLFFAFSILLLSCNNSETTTDAETTSKGAIRRTDAAMYGFKSKVKHVYSVMYDYITDSRGTSLPLDTSSGIKLTEHFFNEAGNFDSTESGDFRTVFSHPSADYTLIKEYELPERSFSRIKKRIYNTPQQFTDYVYDTDTIPENSEKYIVKETTWLDYDFSILKTRKEYTNSYKDKTLSATRSGDTLTVRFNNPNDKYTPTGVKHVNIAYDKHGNATRVIMTTYWADDTTTKQLINTIEYYE